MGGPGRGRSLPQSLPNSKCKDRKEKRGNEIAGPNDFKAGNDKLVPQFVSRVAAAMFQRFVVLAPEKAVSRNGDQNQTIFLPHAMDFSQAVQVVSGMFQNIQGSYDVEDARDERQVFDG